MHLSHFELQKRSITGHGATVSMPSWRSCVLNLKIFSGRSPEKPGFDVVLHFRMSFCISAPFLGMNQPIKDSTHRDGGLRAIKADPLWWDNGVLPHESLKTCSLR